MRSRLPGGFIRRKGEGEGARLQREEGERIAWRWEPQGPQKGAGAGQVDPEPQRAAVLRQPVFGGGPEVLLEDKPLFMHSTCVCGTRT